MRFKNALSLTVDNFVNVFKLLLFQIITGVFFFGISYTILSVNLKPIIESAEAAEIVRLIEEFFLALTSGNVESLKGFNENLLAAGKAFLAMLGGMTAPLVWAAVGIVLLYLFSRFVNGLGTFTVGVAIDNRMETYGKTKFSTTFFANFGKAAIYQLIYVPLSFLYTVLTAAITWFIFFYALKFLPAVLTLMMAFTAIVVLQTLKYAVLYAWMPLVIREGKPVVKAFRECFSYKGKFWSRFANFLACIYLIVIVNVIGAVATLGSFLFVSVPLSFLLLLCMQFVCFFENAGRKYFIAYNRIENVEPVPEILG